MREDWIECKFDEVFFTTSGGTPSRRNENYYIGNIPWIKSGELKSNIITEAEEFISEEAVKNSSAKVFPAGTILLALYGATIGKIAILGIPAATNQAICGIFETPFVFSKYAYYYLVNKKSYLIKQGIGGAQPNISQTILKNLDFPLPPLPEQRALVKKLESLFSSLDAGVADLKKAQHQLKIYRQAVLKKAFEGELTNNKKVEYVHLGELCDGVEYGTSAKSNENGEIPVLRMGNIQNGLFDWKNLVYTDDRSEIDKYLLEKYDVLFNRTNSAELVGKTAIYKGERPAIFAGYLIRIKYKKNVLDPFYLCYYLNSHEAKNYGSSVKSFGVNQSNINGSKLKAYPIPFTPFEEQKKTVKQIESRLSVCDSIEQNIKESLKKAEALRQSILKKAFEGNLLTAQELADCKLAEDYEPAGVLLERIKLSKK